MDVQDIVDGCADIRLEDEDTGFLVYPGPATATTLATERKAWSLVGKFLTDRAIKVDVMKQVLAIAWRSLIRVQISDVFPNLFLFSFYHETDMRRELEEGPWSFDNATLFCKQIRDGERPTQMTLDSIDMWMQIYNPPSPPLGYYTDVILEKFGWYVGIVVKLNERNFVGLWRSFYRVRVTIDVSKPLKHRMKLIKRDSTWT